VGIDIPQPFVTKIAGPIGPVTVDGIPDTFHLNVDTIPKIQLGIDPVTLNPVTLNPVQATVSLTPVDVTMRIDRIPDVRAHLPADFTLGICLLGMQVMAVRLCGEAQVITEPYVPGPCEQAGEPEAVTGLTPLPEHEA
jgi:hypothetical protein